MMTSIIEIGAFGLLERLRNLFVRLRKHVGLE